jgi:3-isopropylmalate/(R)-2-methylmalate dehydratase small subunit
MQPFTPFTSRVIVLPVDDIDTDQIIPARFLKTIDKTGLANNLFADWRYLPDGTPDPDFPLNRPESQGAQVLLAGNNFGCGSSREHAPWALIGYGLHAVISTSIADIFHNNALKNGLLPVVVDTQAHQRMLALFTTSPQAELTIDLASQTISLPDGQDVGFAIDGFAKTCLLNGVDEVGYLLSMEDRIAAYEAAITGYQDG